jgi:hypothetical protein
MPYLPPSDDPPPPGVRRWFDPADPEYEQCIKAREKFLEKISRADQSPNIPLVRDMLEASIEHLDKIPIDLAPTGFLSIIKNIVQTVNEKKRKREIWHKATESVINHVFQVYQNYDVRFVFSFNQMAVIWNSAGGGNLTKDHYKKMYSLVTPDLTAGNSSRVINEFPVLRKYTDSRILEFSTTYTAYILMVEGGWIAAAAA